MSALGDIIGGLLSPIKDVINKREDRKQAHQAANAALTAAQQADATSVTIANAHMEEILAGGLAGTWKDEYATVSVIGATFNSVLIGGVLTAFGYPQFLQGVLLAIRTLVEIGVDVGWITTATVMAAIGLSVWRKI